MFTQNPDLADDVAERLEVGMVGLNSTIGSKPNLPLGGVKASGIGRALGRLGLDEFANKKLNQNRLTPAFPHYGTYQYTNQRGGRFQDWGGKEIPRATGHLLRGQPMVARHTSRANTWSTSMTCCMPSATSTVLPFASVLGFPDCGWGNVWSDRLPSGWPNLSALFGWVPAGHVSRAACWGPPIT